MNFEIISPYSPKKKVSLSSFEKTLTKQEFKDDCDINLIVKRYKKDGVITHVNPDNPIFAEFAPQDYRNLLDLSIEADQAFKDLPSSLRKRFNNDPVQLMEFVSNIDDNYDEGVELGLYSRRADDDKAPDKTQPEVDKKAAKNAAGNSNNSAEDSKK